MSDEQASIIHNPLSCGLYRTIAPIDDQVDHGRWMRACAEGGFVGQCRLCGGYLRPLRPHEVTGHRTDYEAQCINSACEHSVLAPGGRTQRRSAQHSEAPAGWWDHRTQRLKKGGSAA